MYTLIFADLKQVYFYKSQFLCKTTFQGTLVKKQYKGTVMQIEKVLINDRLRVSKVSWKFPIPTIYNFAVIYPWNLLFS